MKKLFRGYYKLTEAEIQDIWENGFISLDTNVLFNIYRYSEETRKELLNVIRRYSSQLWLTHHAAFEFHKNRISVISDQIGIYDETIKTFNKLEADIIKNLKTPHLSKTVLAKFEKTIKETVKDLNNKKEFYKKLLNNDKILSSITSIFNNKVGEAFTTDELIKIEKEGEDRYKKKVPPGFKDNDKSENKFGDLIIWKELIRKAKSDNKPFILIIDDVKEDWWLRAQGQTISPRQELAQELYKETEQLFHLYTPDRFLEFAAKTEAIKQETIDEVREIRIESDNLFYHPTDLSAQMFPSSLAEIMKANETLKTLNQFNQFNGLSESLKASTKLSELVKNSDFMRNLDTLQTLGDITKSLAPSTQLQTKLSNLRTSFEPIGLAKSLLPNMDLLAAKKQNESGNGESGTNS